MHEASDVKCGSKCHAANSFGRHNYGNWIIPKKTKRKKRERKIGRKGGRKEERKKERKEKKEEKMQARKATGVTLGSMSLHNRLSSTKCFLLQPTKVELSDPEPRAIKLHEGIIYCTSLLIVRTKYWPKRLWAAQIRHFDSFDLRLNGQDITP